MARKVASHSLCLQTCLRNVVNGDGGDMWNEPTKARADVGSSHLRRRDSDSGSERLSLAIGLCKKRAVTTVTRRASAVT